MNRSRLRRPLFAPAVLAAIVATGLVVEAAAERTTDAGWRAYVQATEQRRASERNGTDRFLALSHTAEAAAERRAVLAGTIVIRHVETPGGNGRSVDVPGALVHHWRGAVFVPGARVDALLAQLHAGTPPRLEDVLDSRVLERGPDRLRLYLKLQRRKFVTVVYNTEHDVTFRRLSPTRGESTSVATRIVELADPGTPQERELRVGEDRGFLWRLNAYWRYDQTPGGVIAECESITLSRTVPSLVRPVVTPLIDSAAHESMDRTLTAFRRQFAR